MGKGGEKVVDSGVKKEVLIDGELYDVTNFKHPGGSVMDFYAGKGIDASQSFHQFHVRSKKVDKYMKSLPHRPADAKMIKDARSLDDKQDQLLKDFDAFTKQLEAEGYFKPSLIHVTYRISEILALYGAGFWLMKNYNGNVAMFVVGIVLAAIAQGRCGWLMHEGGHISLTGELIDGFNTIVCRDKCNL